MPGPYDGKQITWFPTANELEARKGIDPREWNNFRFKNKGATDKSGVSVIFKKAFETPNSLALTLCHEKVHFEQFTTKGRGDAKRFHQREIEAWGLEKLHAAGLGLTGDELRAHEIEADGQIHENELLDALELAKKKASKKRWNPREAEILQPHSERELEEISRRADELDAIVAAELEFARQEREKVEAEKREVAKAEERSRREAVGRDSLGYLWAGCESACRRGGLDRTFLNIPMVPEREFYCENGPVTMSADDSCVIRIYGMVLGQICRGVPFDPNPLNETIRTVFGPGPGVAPPVLGVDPSPRPGVIEASAPPGARWALEKLAAKACADPSGLTREDTAGLNWFPDRNLGPMADVPDNLQGCARELFGELARLNMTGGRGGGIDLEWLRGQAVRLLAPADSGPDSGKDREEETGRRGSGVGDGSGPARDQAGKIGRGGKWPR